MSCDGAFAEYCIVDARSSAIVPKSMSFPQACPLACAGTTIYTAIKRTQIQPGQVLGIVGLGALGMLGIQMSVQMGFKTVGVDSRSEPVALAKSVMGSKTGDCRFLQSSVGLEEARRVVRDLDQDRVWDGVDAVILATDALESVEYATSLVKKHGTFVLLGSCARLSSLQHVTCKHLKG